MARNIRQNKILEIISSKAVETQDELVSALRSASFDVTQATISRDIKELGLIKILGENKKYRYATVSNSQVSVSNKNIGLLKDCIISVRTAMNLVVVRVLEGTASLVRSMIDKMSLQQNLGSTSGEDTVLFVTADPDDAYMVKSKINEMLV